MVGGFILDKTDAAEGEGGLWVGEVRGDQDVRQASQVGDETTGLIFWGNQTTSTYNQRSYAGIVGTVEAGTGNFLGGSIDFRTALGATAFTRHSRLKIMHNGELKLGTDGFLTFDEHASAPATPSSGRVALYAKADGKFYRKDDTGTERELGLDYRDMYGMTLDNLGDVATYLPSDGDVLTWDATLRMWTAEAPPAASGGGYPKQLGYAGL